jgi:hypothetical protein
VLCPVVFQGGADGAERVVDGLLRGSAGDERGCGVEAHHLRGVITSMMRSTLLAPSRYESQRPEKQGDIAEQAFWHGNCVGIADSVSLPVTQGIF